MKFSFLFFIFLSTSFLAGAQSFSSAVAGMQAVLQTVENNKNQITQTLKEKEPGVLLYTCTTTTIKDGKSQQEVYEFNLADIDINTIRAFTNKDVIQVQCLVAKKQKFIKKTTDSQKSNYEQEVFFYAKNIDNGRELVEGLKALVPISESIIDKRLSLKSYQEHITWLETNTKQVNLLDKQYVQTLTSSAKIPGRLEFTVDQVSSGKSVNSSFQFNLANLNPNSIFAEVKGDVIVVHVETRRKLDVIKAFATTVQKDYVNDFEMYCESVEKSRDLQKVLKQAVLLSEDKIDAMIPKIKSVGEGIEILNSKIKSVTINEVTFTQQLLGDCVLSFTKKEATPTKMTDNSYQLNLRDLGRNLIAYNTEGKNVVINCKTKAGSKFIKFTENQVLKNYTNQIEFQLGEVEDAIVCLAVLERLVELCEAQEIRVSGSKKELLNQIKNNISKVTENKLTYEQLLELKEDPILQFKSTEIGEKSSKLKVFEFNINDINPVTVAFNTSSTAVYVSLSTNYMEKIIKYYEDGAIKNYQNTFTIQTSTIEEARLITELFKKVLQTK
ncbi:MAG: hypothetical protein RL699_1273 [Bacteroidota bacterium]|jgi:hypothetical protein